MMRLSKPELTTRSGRPTDGPVVGPLVGLVERTSRKLSRSVGFGADLSGRPDPGLCTIELPFSDCDGDDNDENDFSSLADN